MCVNNPCQGGGTCSSTDVGTYVCTCPEDRMGRHCEKGKIQAGVDFLFFFVFFLMP